MIKLHGTLSWSQQQYWYKHIEKEVSYGLSRDSYVVREEARRLKADTKTRGSESARYQTEENGLPRHNRNQPFGRGDRDLSVVLQYDEWYPFSEEDTYLIPMHETLVPKMTTLQYLGDTFDRYRVPHDRRFNLNLPRLLRSQMSLPSLLLASLRPHASHT